GPETCVGVYVERSLETAVATLAVLLAGGAYVPLDTAFPADRITLMLTETRTTLVLTHPTTHHTLPHGPWTTLNL
ncbi:AMP-binding protein, partial [Streptomyces sp. JWR5-1]